MTEKVKQSATKARTIINNLWEFLLSVSCLVVAGAILNEVHKHHLDVTGVLFGIAASVIAVEGGIRFVKFLSKE